MYDPPGDRIPHAARPGRQVDPARIARLVLGITGGILGPDIVLDKQMVRVSAGKNRDHCPNQGGRAYGKIAAIPINNESSRHAIADGQILDNQPSDIFEHETVDRALSSKLLLDQQVMQFNRTAAWPAVMLLQLKHRVQAAAAVDDRRPLPIIAPVRALDNDRPIGQALNPFYQEIRVVGVDLINASGQPNDATGGYPFQSPLELVE